MEGQSSSRFPHAGRRVKRTALLAGIAVLLGFAGSSPAAVSNGQIAFSSNRDGDFDIFSMNPDGTVQAQLTTGTGISNIEPAWSPDGGTIAFSTNRHGLFNFEIYTMSPTGTSQARLTTNSVDDVLPSFSPNGSKIAFASEAPDDLDLEIWVMNSNGTQPQQLTSNSSYDAEPTWSPDGSRIAFTSRRDGDSEIYVMYANGAAQANLTNDSAFDDEQPAWSPNGQRIAYVYRQGDYEVYLMNTFGTEKVALTTNSDDDRFPAWSPDGRMIAFTSDRDSGQDDIFVMNADGTGQANVSNRAPASDQNPAWQPVVTADPPTQTPQPGPDEIDYTKFCTLHASSPDLQLGQELEVKRNRAKKSTVRRMFRRGLKGFLSWPNVAGRLIDCRHLKLVVLEKDGRRYFAPGTRLRVAKKLLSASGFSKAVSRLKRKGVGRVTTTAEVGDQRTRFTYRAFAKRSRLARGALRRLQRRRYRGHFTLFYSVEADGRQLVREVPLT